MRRKSKKSQSRSVLDDIEDFESETLGPMRPASPIALRLPVRPSVVHEDRRRWDPDGSWAVRDAFGRKARVGMSPQASPKTRQRAGVMAKPGISRSGIPMIREATSFVAPRGVMICVRRKIRREVLFAKNRTRKGAGSAKRRNHWSDYKC